MDYTFQLRGGKQILVTTRDTDEVENLEWGSSVPYVQEFLAKNRKSTAFFYGEFSMRLYCFFQLQGEIEGTYSSFLDMLGGLGCTGKIFEVDPGQTFLNDLDDSCLDILRANFIPQCVVKHDACHFPWRDDVKYDLVLSDFNNLTLPRAVGEYQNFLDGMFDHAGKYVIITECSIFHLKYGERSYQNYERLMGTTFPHTHEGFFTAVRAWYRTLYPDWFLTDVEYFSASAYFMFRREEKDLRIRYNTRDDMEANRPIRMNPVPAKLSFPDDFIGQP